MDQSAKPSAPKDDWLSCKASQGKRYKVRLSAIIKQTVKSV